MNSLKLAISSRDRNQLTNRFRRIPTLGSYRILCSGKCLNATNNAFSSTCETRQINIYRELTYIPLSQTYVSFSSLIDALSIKNQPPVLKNICLETYMYQSNSSRSQNSFQIRIFFNAKINGEEDELEQIELQRKEFCPSKDVHVCC